MIDPEKIRKYFREHPMIKPVSGAFTTRDAEGHLAGCCGLSALALADGHHPDSLPTNTSPMSDATARLAGLIGADVPAVVDFIAGWDYPEGRYGPCYLGVKKLGSELSIELGATLAEAPEEDED